MIESAQAIYTEQQAHDATLKYFDGDQLATDVWVKKYCLKNENDFFELSPVDMHWRIANELARIEAKYPNPRSTQDIFERLDHFRRIVPGGSPMSGIGNNYQIVSLSNCFVIGNDHESDSYGGILKLDQEIVQLEKRRGGVGMDLSFIRPAGSPVKNSAITSTGVVPFMERYSNSTKEVAQDGRRGALMLSISVKHPDSEAFIDAKLIQGKVTGANISVKLTDEFMQCVINEKPFTQQFPIDSTNPTHTKVIDAKKVWKKIIHNAWKSAEPGMLYWDTILRESIPDCYADLGFKTVSTNPCIIGNSIIATADGRNGVPLKQLAEENKDVLVYSTNTKTGQLEIKYGRNPRKTGDKKEVWKLTLDDDSVFIATPDHKIQMKDLWYKELKDLIIGESITPFYSFDSNGYRQLGNIGVKMIGGARRNGRQYRAIYEFLNGPVNKADAIHHKDFNKGNDSPDNLIAENRIAHHRMHSDKMKGLNNPYHRMSSDWKLNFASHPGETNGNFSGVTNEDLLMHGKSLYQEVGRFTRIQWKEYAEQNKLPMFLSNEFRFGSFTNFINQISINHKVKSIEFYGYEDVYNITVDDNHNYHVITSAEDSNYITSSGICVKNCGEIPLCADDSCRLLSVNLFGYVINPFTDEAEFDYAMFNNDVVEAQRYMDDIIDLELEKIDGILAKIQSDPEEEFIKLYETNLWVQIKKKTIAGRRTGLGITSEGDMLAAMGLTYGTDKANDFAEEIQKILKTAAYYSSVTMAHERGAFPIYDAFRELQNPFITRISKENPNLFAEMMKYGRRNIALLTIAPTGSLSILTQTTSGCEPVFLPAYKRRRKINPQEKDVHVDFTDNEGVAWSEYSIFHHNFVTWLKVKGYDLEVINKLSTDELNEIIKISPYYLATSNDVNWVKKVEMQGRLQKHIDHSISVTVNLPKDATEELVSKVYETGWKSGCKGLTVYRDGSRDGVLISNNDKKEKAKIDMFQDNHAPKRPKRMKADVVRFQNNNEKWIGVVGLLDGRPYELFTGKFENGLSILPAYVKECEVIRNKVEPGEDGRASRYDIEYIDNIGAKISIPGISKKFNPEYWNYAKLVSGVLRHGMPLIYVYDLVESLNLNNDNLNTWKAGVLRIIKKYIKDGVKPKGKCLECGSDQLEYVEGCLVCRSCGWAKCQ